MSENDEALPNGSPDTGNENREPESEVDIGVKNIMSCFSVRCHLDLKQIALTSWNVEYNRTMNVVTKRFRKPLCTASIHSSGKITMTGTTSEVDAKIGARRCARILQKLGYNVKFTNFRIANVLATCSMPFAIKIEDFAKAHPKVASYEPELHPGVTFQGKDNATLNIFSTGRMTITAPKVETVQAAVEEVYHLVYGHRRVSHSRKRIVSEPEEDDFEFDDEPLSARIKRKRRSVTKKVTMKVISSDSEEEEEKQVRIQRGKKGRSDTEDYCPSGSEKEEEEEEELKKEEDEQMDYSEDETWSPPQRKSSRQSKKRRRPDTDDEDFRPAKRQKKRGSRKSTR